MENFVPYKLKSIEIFSKDEWLANNRRRYRTVFEVMEVDFLYFHVELYNKWFDEQDWQMKLEFKVVEAFSGKVRYNQVFDLNVPKTDNIFYFSYGYGNEKKGAYWKTGSYKFIVLVNDIAIGEKFFYINNFGLVTADNNPYFDVVSLNIFESDKRLPDKIVHLKQVAHNARYVWVDFKIKHKVPKGTPFEFDVFYYDDAGQLKAHIQNFENTVVDKGEEASYYVGWGSSAGTSWVDNKYIVNVVFMDQLVASTYFEVGDSYIEGSNFEQTTELDKIFKQNFIKAQSKDEDLNELLRELNSLIGLSQVKEQILNHIKYLEYLNLRKKQGLEEKHSHRLHSLFIGNPGTGKTTVVRLLAKIYHKLGLLSKGHIVEVTRNDLIGEYIGQTAPKTQDCINRAIGGVLFIDEAYSLARSTDDTKDFGREVIEILIKAMSDGPEDLAIMAAGYPEQMKTFLNSNPGLKSRFNYVFHFPDYTPEELLEIAKYHSKQLNVFFSDDAIDVLKNVIQEAYRNRDNTFGNARFVNYLVEQSKQNLGIRLSSMPDFRNLDKMTLSTITAEDVKKAVAQTSNRYVEMEIDESLLAEALSELNNLIGLEKIKNEVNDLVKIIKYYKEIKQNVYGSISLHSVFTGNPGTGKTTVARILSKIYKALGILQRGHLVEVQRDGLIAEYVGQTAVKTRKVIEQALGGLLFIDEAYGLMDSKFSYGAEAVEVLLKCMEDYRGQFVVVVAGYTEPMQAFLKSNPGLMSRFDKYFHFHDYSYEELCQIFEAILKQKNYSITEEAKNFVYNFISELYKNRDKFFGNAREIRKVVDEIIMKQNLRMANTPKELRKDLFLITMSDVEHLRIQSKGKTFGFN